MGFRIVDRLAADHRISLRTRRYQAVFGVGEIGGETVCLAKPMTYMNLSGQAVAALVVSSPDSEVGIDDVTAAVRASLAGYKVPRHVRIVEQVPRLPNGKVDYEAATALAGEEVTIT